MKVIECLSEGLGDWMAAGRTALARQQGKAEVNKKYKAIWNAFAKWTAQTGLKFAANPATGPAPAGILTARDISKKFAEPVMAAAMKKVNIKPNDKAGLTMKQAGSLVYAYTQIVVSGEDTTAAPKKPKKTILQNPNLPASLAKLRVADMQQVIQALNARVHLSEAITTLGLGNPPTASSGATASSAGTTGSAPGAAAKPAVSVPKTMLLSKNDILSGIKMLSPEDAKKMLAFIDTLEKKASRKSQTTAATGSTPPPAPSAAPTITEVGSAKKPTYPMTLLTRADSDVGSGTFDSVQWAIDKVKAPLGNIAKSAVLYGSEDAPSRIEFYKESELTVTKASKIRQKPIYVWAEKN